MVASESERATKNHILFSLRIPLLR